MWTRIFCVFFLVSLAALSWRDIKEQEFPDVWIIICLISGISMDFSVSGPCFFNVLVWRIRPAMIVWAVWLLCAVLASVSGRPVPVGMGAARLFSVLALVLGGYAAAFVFCASSLLSGAYAAVLLISGRTEKGARIPLGPFISCSVVIFMVISGT